MKLLPHAPGTIVEEGTWGAEQHTLHPGLEAGELVSVTFKFFSGGNPNPKPEKGFVFDKEEGRWTVDEGDLGLVNKMNGWNAAETLYALFLLGTQKATPEQLKFNSLDAGLNDRVPDMPPFAKLDRAGLEAAQKTAARELNALMMVTGPALRASLRPAHRGELLTEDHPMPNPDGIAVFDDVSEVHMGVMARIAKTKLDAGMLQTVDEILESARPSDAEAKQRSTGGEHQ